jgi:uncharacterized protein YcbK (DUF882 family)
LLKALVAGLTLAGISLPAFSAAKTTVTKAKQAVKTAKTTQTTGTTKTAAKTTKSASGTGGSTKTSTKTTAKTTTKTAQSSKGGRTGARVQTVQSKGSVKGGKSTSVAKGSRKPAPRDYDDEVVTRVDTSASPGLVRAVSLDIVNTGEKGREIVYFEHGQYQADALFELNLLLRDWRADKVRAIDPKVFDTLYMLQQMTSARRPFEIVSAYRSPLTNFTLLLEGDGIGVARRSLHMDGRAVDIRLPGVHLAHLNKAAVQLGYGGVGYYPGSGFLHVDTGDVRRWRA